MCVDADPTEIVIVAQKGGCKLGNNVKDFQHLKLGTMTLSFHSVTSMSATEGHHPAKSVGTRDDRAGMGAGGCM